MCRKLICLVSLTMFFVLSGVQANVILYYDASKDTGDLDGDGNVEWEDVTEVSGTGANGDGTGLADWDWDTSLMGIGDSGVGTPPAVDSAYSGITNAFYFAEDNDARGHTIARQQAIPLSFADLSPDPTSSSSTWEIWFRPDNLNGQKVLVETGAGSGSSLTLNGSMLQFAVRDSGVDDAGVSVDLNGFDTSDFLQAVGVIDMDNDFIALYINGNLVAGGPGGDADSQFTGNRWAGTNGATLGDGDGDDSGNMGVGGRQGTFGELNGYAPFQGYVAIFRLYDYALTEREIQEIMNVMAAQAIASNPNPANEATDVPRDVVLSWTPGKYAPPSNGHKVYLSQNFNDVTNGIGGVAQDANSYSPPQRLDLGKTYYWRVDEVNAPPESTVFEGRVWQFTTEPIGYPIENVIATASSVQQANMGPENTVNGSGLDDNDLHATGEMNMWLSSTTGPQPSWIQYEFDKVYKLHEMWVWNSNQFVEPMVGFGFKDVSIEYSVDGADYATLGTTHEFAQAPGALDYAHNTTVDFDGVAAKYVRLTANSNWGGFLPQYGLSEVRFFHIPVRAREPSPVSGQTDVDLDVILSWRAGREAAEHDVYVGTDEQAVVDGTAPVTTVTETSHGPLSLDLGQSYYWKVSEVNMAESPTTWDGDVWNFATPESLVVDDFESYNDLDVGEPESNRIFLTWIDGWEVPTNGSLVGYENPPFCEQTIVHGGRQSMPFFYDNSGTARYSEAELALSPPQDWTKHAVNALSLWFSGDPNNVPDQMYVKVNGSKITYDGAADNVTLKPWQPWNIDLASLGIDLRNATKLSIGFGDEASMTPGGSGAVFFDDIRLYPYSRQLATPAEPNAAGLVAHYEFEGTTNDSSGNGLHGTAMGSPAFAAGKVGQAVSLDGLDDFVEITGYKGILGPNAVTVTAWINMTSTAAGTIVGWGPNVDGQRFGFRVDADRLRMEHAGGNLQANSNVNDGRWHHVAVIVQENATISYPDVILYLDGIDDTRASTDPDAFNLTADQDVRIGSRPASNDRFFMGLIDDVRIYDRVLRQEEIAWLAGRTEPFDKPF